MNNHNNRSPDHQVGCAATLKEDSELLPTTKAFYVSAEDNPNMIVFLKMEKILEKMQEEKSGVAIRTVKSFMSKIPSVFTGQDLIAWLIANMDFSDVNEALCLANRMASFGYFFPVDDHVLTVRNDSTYYRFQVRLKRAREAEGRPSEASLKYFLRSVFKIFFSFAKRL